MVSLGRHENDRDTTLLIANRWLEPSIKTNNARKHQLLSLRDPLVSRKRCPREQVNALDSVNSRLLARSRLETDDENAPARRICQRGYIFGELERLCLLVDSIWAALEVDGIRLRHAEDGLEIARI